MIFKIFLITFALFFVNLKLCVSCEIDLYEKLLTTPHDANQDLSLVLQIKTKYEAHGRYLPRLGRIISSDDKIDIEQEIEEEKIKASLLLKKNRAILEKSTEIVTEIDKEFLKIMQTEMAIGVADSQLYEIESQKNNLFAKCITGCFHRENEEEQPQENRLRERIETLKQEKIRLGDQMRLLTDARDKLEEEKKF